MTTAVLTERDPVVLPHGRDRGQSLDAVISSAWAALLGGTPVACPLCDGTLAPRPDSTAAACRSCGAELS